MTVVGYNHKLRILLETVIEKIANFEVKPDRFSVIKVSVIFLTSFILDTAQFPFMADAHDIVQFYFLSDRLI